MRVRFRAPRLLPVTIATLAVVLLTRTVVLVRSAIDSGEPAALITATWAAAPETPAPATKPGDKPAPKPGDYGQQIRPGPGAERQPAEENSTVPEGPPPMTDGEKAVLLQLRERRKELDTREAALTARESLLTAAEMKLSARVEELRGLQTRLESLDATHKQQENAAWQGLVKVYEDMKPRDAATIFNDLGMPVLLAVVDRMKEAKAAAILAAMAPDKARDVTTQLAQLRTRAATPPDATGKPPGSGKAPGSGT